MASSTTVSGICPKKADEKEKVNHYEEAENRPVTSSDRGCCKMRREFHSRNPLCSSLGLASSLSPWQFRWFGRRNEIYFFTQIPTGSRTHSRYLHGRQPSSHRTEKTPMSFILHGFQGDLSQFRLFSRLNDTVRWTREMLSEYCGLLEWNPHCTLHTEAGPKISLDDFLFLLNDWPSYSRVINSWCSSINSPTASSRLCHPIKTF